jgi:hypothetical protein
LTEIEIQTATTTTKYRAELKYPQFLFSLYESVVDLRCFFTVESKKERDTSLSSNECFAIFTHQFRPLISNELEQTINQFENGLLTSEDQFEELLSRIHNLLIAIWSLVQLLFFIPKNERETGNPSQTQHLSFLSFSKWCALI